MQFWPPSLAGGSHNNATLHTALVNHDASVMCNVKSTTVAVSSLVQCIQAVLMPVNGPDPGSAAEDVRLNTPEARQTKHEAFEMKRF